MTRHGTSLNLSTARTEWLLDRRTGLGGSDIAGVLGLSPWASPWSVWADKVGALPLDDEPTDAQEFGLLAEPMLREVFHRRTGLFVVGVQESSRHPDHPWARVSLDGLVAESEHTDPSDVDALLGVFESKTTSEPLWADDVPPVYYQCQAQWAMWIRDTDRCWFMVLHTAYGRPVFRPYLFERDDEDIAFIVDACRRFWFDHVTTGIPPATDGHDATLDALARAFPGAAAIDDSVEADDELAAHVAGYVDASSRIKALEQTKAGHRAAIEAALGNRTTLTRGETPKGAPIVLATWKPQPRSRFALDEFRARFPGTARRFTRTDQIRVFRPKTSRTRKPKEPT